MEVVDLSGREVSSWSVEVAISGWLLFGNSRMLVLKRDLIMQYTRYSMARELRAKLVAYQMGNQTRSYIEEEKW
jgi:hypothetical protein